VSSPDAKFTDPTSANGFDVAPRRSPILTAALFVVVVLSAGAFAHYFRESLRWTIELYGSSPSATSAARHLSRWVVFATVSAAIAVAALIGAAVEHRWSGQVGIESVAASARGEQRRISGTATAVRGLATWIVSSGMVSIGRESAIIEAGGALGAVGARRLRGRGDMMAAVGIAAAFSAAYHAPLAAIIYVEEHLQVRKSRRARWFVPLGAIGGHVVSAGLLGGHTIFPPIQGSRWNVLWLGLVGLIPAVISSRCFLELRLRVKATNLASRAGLPHWSTIALLSLVAGAAVAIFPIAAGNGMDALRQASIRSTVALAVGLSVGKAIGTIASLGAGAPGGVLTPTISISAGVALLTLLALHGLGFGMSSPWDGIVAAMAVGFAVGMRSPFGAIALVPELLGDYGLIPAIAIIVFLAWVLNRGLDQLFNARHEPTEILVLDEDA
jgi:chloride channel protein, CIC family